MQEIILTQQQLDLIEKHLISDHHKLFFAIARYTGERIINIQHLKVNQVYNEAYVPRCHITFLREQNKKHDLYTCKPLADVLKICSPKNFLPNDLLFPSSILKDRPISQKAIHVAITNAARKAGLGFLNVSPRMIKDAFIVHLSRSGVSNKEIKSILGVPTIPEILNRTSRKSIDSSGTLERVFDSRCLSATQIQEPPCSLVYDNLINHREVLSKAS